MSETYLSSQQIKAARALLDWSQDELARLTGISIATIRRLETGYISPRGATTGVVKQCFESAGIEFFDSDGLRRRPSGIAIFEGSFGGKDFLDDIKHTAQRYGGDILIVTPTVDDFAKYCGLSNILELDCLVDSNGSVCIKCLVTDEGDTPLSTPRFQFRIISRSFLDPVPFCVYGEKYGLAAPNGKPFSKLIIIDSMKMAAASKRHFASMWDKATQTVALAEEKAKVS